MSDTIHDNAPDRARRAVTIGLALSVAWLVLVVGFFLLAGLGGGDGLSVLPAIMVVIAVVGPIALIASVSVAMAMVAQAAQIRALGIALRRQRAQPVAVPDTRADLEPVLSQLGDQLGQVNARLEELELWLAERAATIDAAGVALRAVPAQGSGPGDADEGAAPDTPDLGLTEDAAQAPVPLDVFIRALDFPVDADDRAGFDALRVALRDHRSAQMVTAAQDVLTLLSQDGLYMDDLVPDRARVDLWRRFAQGERGGAVAPVGGIRDEDAVDLCIARMRQDTIFRDAVHHFLRLFDHQFTELEPHASDPQVAAWSETRSARAFMLLGRAAGIFHE